MAAGWIRRSTLYVMNAFLALPGILLAIAFVAFMGPRPVERDHCLLAISGWVGYARLVRGRVMAVKEREFVEAARALGASDLRILRQAHPAQHSSAADRAGSDRDGNRRYGGGDPELSGAGSSASGGELGASMLNDARSHLFDSPHMVFFPAMAVMLCDSLFQLQRRRAQGLHGPKDADASRNVRHPSYICVQSIQKDRKIRLGPQTGTSFWAPSTPVFIL